ncbi:MAG: triosephosphate isomerase [Sulfurovum sp. PC08-66]|jgi:triosephosphate isomerase|nr:MAG: triosephosphate isomerase [Sulfurovum sp. PC08-66]
MIFAANFKANHTRASTKVYIQTLETLAQKVENPIYVFPPLSAIDDFATSKLVVGVQNAYPARNGAFTGEVGVEQLEEFGIKTILIGHSERREILGESQESVAKKFAFFKEQGFAIIYCLGEPLEVRQEGQEALQEYLFAQLEGIDLHYDKLIVAYEPIWAIGTGVSATTADIRATHQLLKKVITQAPLLYGGSAKLDNIKEIADISEVDGVLVGSASLDAHNFFAMIEASR